MENAVGTEAVFLDVDDALAAGPGELEQFVDTKALAGDGLGAETWMKTSASWISSCRRCLSSSELI